MGSEGLKEAGGGWKKKEGRNGREQTVALS